MHRSRSMQDFCTPSGSTMATVPTATTTGSSDKSPPTTGAIKKKMVAKHDIKNTTQSPIKSRHSAPHQQADIIDATTTAAEELSYGPGIVSKLRGRYQGLAQRESTNKDRHCLQKRRRTTSLNSLLGSDVHQSNVEHKDGKDMLMGLYGGVVINIASNSKFKANIFEEFSSPAATSTLVSKKTAALKKYAKANSAGTSPAKDSLRTNKPAAAPVRDFKSGNDALKRAHSVETVLSEKKSRWHLLRKHTSFDQTRKESIGGSDALSSSSLSARDVVTIEEKICNARKRLILGTDTMPPTRVTSIIDDSERPPTDVVKQARKIFEATANQRSQPNSRGYVASKVANYKSIIKESMPATVIPKPRPTSATQKLDRAGSVGGVGGAGGSGGRQQPNVKPVLAANIDTPTSSLHPKWKQLQQKHQQVVALMENRGLSSAAAAGATYSPVAALTKNFEKMCFDTDKQ